MHRTAGGKPSSGGAHLWRSLGRHGPDHALAAVPVVWLTAFFLGPLAFTVVFSFGHSTFGSVALGFTWANYAAALSGFYGATFLRTLVFAVAASSLCLLVAFPVGYFIARHTRK